MIDAVIAATGLYTPPQSLSNAELVETFNTYVERFNASHAAEAASTPIGIRTMGRVRRRFSVW